MNHRYRTLATLPVSASCRLGVGLSASSPTLHFRRLYGRHASWASFSVARSTDLHLASPMTEAVETAPQEPISSDYVRVKRKKTTIFLYVEQTDTCHDLRAKVNLITKVPTSDIKFYLDRNGELPIDEHKSLADMKVENDQELYMVYKKEGSDNDWEEIEIGAGPSVAGAVEGSS
ncbi:hypothetical protein AB1Y20_006822 [Prymnesium parvum]|uniref:Ubiquitin-like domain-containing protein n=1 Tax=Prymnesium parvum TaxID=97485 RepID=A0AB34IZI0_PRYPA